MSLYVRQQKRHRDKEQTFGPCGEGEGGTIWENSIETYILPCEIDHQSILDAWNMALKAGTLGQPRGMGWWGSWEGVLDGGHMYTHGWFKSMYGKNYHNIVKYYLQLI